MEAVILVGIQAAGKSTFYKQRFFATHVRISLDLLRTRHRERSLLEWCLAHGQPFVVDNTNPTVAERAAYIAPARAAGFRVVGYYFESNVPSSIRRNAVRSGNAACPRRRSAAPGGGWSCPRAPRVLRRCTLCGSALMAIS
jgi:predicted kinase